MEQRSSPQSSYPPLSNLIGSISRAGDRILEFWSTVALDRDKGGFYPEIGNDGSITRSGEKRLIITARGLWVFSEAVFLTKNQRWLDTADHLFTFLQKYVDSAHGGVFWTVDQDGAPIASYNDHGEPVGRRKQLYAQAFALYGLAAYARVRPESSALFQARELFRLIIEKGKDAQYGGYLEAFDEEWRELNKPSMNPPWDLESPKRTNTHLHLMEAYSQLLLVAPTPEVIEEQAHLLCLMVDKVLADNGHLKEYMHRDFSAFPPEHDPRAITVSYGHDIEAAWLLQQASEILRSPEVSAVVATVGGENGSRLADLVSRACDKAAAGTARLAEVSYREGRNPDDGSMYHELHYNHIFGNLAIDRHWWPQAEGLVGYLAGFEVTGDKKLLDAFRSLWHYVESCMLHPSGEWYRGRRADGSLDGDPIVSVWKCPYHNWRATMECVRRLERLTRQS